MTEQQEKWTTAQCNYLDSMLKVFKDMTDEEILAFDKIIDGIATRTKSDEVRSRLLDIFSKYDRR